MPEQIPESQDITARMERLEAENRELVGRVNRLTRLVLAIEGNILGEKGNVTTAEVAEGIRQGLHQMIYPVIEDMNTADNAKDRGKDIPHG